MKIADLILTNRSLQALAETEVKTGVWDIRSALKVKRLMRLLKNAVEDYQSSIKELGESTGYIKYENEKNGYIEKFGVKNAKGQSFIDPNDKGPFEAFLKFHDELIEKYKDAIEAFDEPAKELLNSEEDIEIRPEAKLKLSEIENLPGITGEFLNQLHFVLSEDE